MRITFGPGQRRTTIRIAIYKSYAHPRAIWKRQVGKHRAAGAHRSGTVPCRHHTLRRDRTRSRIGRVTQEKVNFCLSRYYKMTRFRIERFDPATQIKEHRSILFVGRSGAGKSTCLIDWLRHLAPRFWCAIFFSPTLESANQFKQIAPSAFVYETALDVDVVAKP